MGSQCISPLGIMETDFIWARAKQRLMHQAEKIIAVADSSKFKGRGSLIVCPLERVDVVITDDGIEQDGLAMLREAQGEVLVARTRGRACPADR